MRQLAILDHDNYQVVLRHRGPINLRNDIHLVSPNGHDLPSDSQREKFLMMVSTTMAVQMEIICQYVWHQLDEFTGRLLVSTRISIPNCKAASQELDLIRQPILLKG